MREREAGPWLLRGPEGISSTLAAPWSLPQVAAYLITLGLPRTQCEQQYNGLEG